MARGVDQPVGERAAAFTAENPDTVVKVQTYRSRAEASAALQKSFKEGDPPDLFEIDGDDRGEADLRRRDRDDTRPGAEVEKAAWLEASEQLQAEAGGRMGAGPERPPRVDDDGDRFGARRDALFDLLDAVLVAGLVPSLAYLSLTAVHRRGWGSLYDALASGTLDRSALRELVGRLNEKVQSGQRIDVVEASRYSANAQVTDRTVEVLLDLIDRKHQADPTRPIILGVGGGMTVQSVMAKLGARLKFATRNLVLRCQSLIPGFSPHEYDNPASYSRYFQEARDERGAALEDVAAVEDGADDGGVGRGAADAELLESFHERRFRVARRRARLVRLGGNLAHRGLLALRDPRQGLGLLALAAVDDEPAGLLQHLAVGPEVVLAHARDARRLQILGSRVEHREKAPHHQVVELRLGVVQVLGLLQRRDDREVIRDLRVVEDALVRPHPALLEDLPRIHRERIGVAEHLERVLHRRQIILRQRARVGARISQHLVSFVERLREGEPLPFDLEGQLLYFVGPTPAPPGRVIGSAGPTTSGRMDRFMPAFLARGLRGFMGKGEIGSEVQRALEAAGAVYFGAIGGTGALLSSAVEAAEEVEQSTGATVRLVNLPWLNRVDLRWLREVIGSRRYILTLDNHYLKGGQGEMLATAIAELALEPTPRILRVGVMSLPAPNEMGEAYMCAFVAKKNDAAVTRYFTLEYDYVLATKSTRTIIAEREGSRSTKHGEGPPMTAGTSD